jgi:hypothetical protein
VKRQQFFAAFPAGVLVTEVRSIIKVVILNKVWPVSGQTQAKDLQFGRLPLANVL